MPLWACTGISILNTWGDVAQPKEKRTHAIQIESLVSISLSQLFLFEPSEAYTEQQEKSIGAVEMSKKVLSRKKGLSAW